MIVGIFIFHWQKARTSSAISRMVSLKWVPDTTMAMIPTGEDSLGRVKGNVECHH